MKRLENDEKKISKVLYKRSYHTTTGVILNKNNPKLLYFKQDKNHLVLGPSACKIFLVCCIYK